MIGTQGEMILEREGLVGQELMPQIRAEFGGVSSRLEPVIQTFAWVRADEFTDSSSDEIVRPPREHAWLADAHVVMSVLGLTMRRGADRLQRWIPRASEYLSPQ